RPLDRKQHERVLRHGGAQLVERHPVVVKLVQQVDPGLPRAVVFEPLEEALCLEVDVGYAPSRRSSRIRSSGISAGSFSSMKSTSSRTNARGSSRCGKWPASGNVMSLLPGISSDALTPCSNGITGSCSPHIRSDGMPFAR